MTNSVSRINGKGSKGTMRPAPYQPGQGGIRGYSDQPETQGYATGGVIGAAPNPQAAIDGGAVTDGALPSAESAAQNAMPTADNPNAVPLFGRVGLNQKFTLGAAGQQGAVADVPVAETMQDGNSYVPTGYNNEYRPASVVGNRTFGAMGDARAGLNANGFRRGEESAMRGVNSAVASHLPGTNSIPGLGGRQVNRRMMMPQNAPAYATGGMIGEMPNEQPGLQPQGMAEGPLDHQMADANLTDMLTRNPQVKQQIQQVIQEAIQSGEIDPQMAQTAVQLARAAIQNPALYPQLRKFAIQRGLVGPNDLPEQYDQGLVLAILTAAKASEGMGDMQPAPQGQPQGQAFAQGGMIQGPGTGTSDSVPAVNTSNGGPVKVSNGEYIVPAAVVQAKGRDFFDGLVRKYAEVPR